MVLLRTLLIFTLVLYLVSTSEVKPTKRTSRLFGSLFGFGIKCTGCPPNFCDDDPAIIYGYCCGCGQFYEYLPVRCSNDIRCPLNGYELCDRYDYMMQCCCGR